MLVSNTMVVFLLFDSGGGGGGRRCLPLRNPPLDYTRMMSG